MVQDFLSMKRIWIVCLALLSFQLGLQAQTGAVTSVRVDMTVPWVAFNVDGQQYQGAATFTWPQGSKHVIQFLTVSTPATAGCSANTQQALQFSQNADTLVVFGGWKDSTGKLNPTADPIQTVTADPSITSFTASVSIAYRVTLLMFDAQSSQLPCSPPSPGAPGPAPDTLRTGVVYLNGAAYWNSAVAYLAAGPITLNAFPYPGFVFAGWSINGTTGPYITTYNLQGPVSIAVLFEPAKRVRFITNPLGLQVYVDRTATPTLPSLDTSTGACPLQYSKAGTTPPGIPPLCFGDFDFLPGSSHVISGVTPQLDQVGKYWVFSVWDRGTGQNTVYTADFNTSNSDTVTANFIPGAHVSFLTAPAGLKLNVDGRENWPAYNFIWGVGETHTIGASDQTGSNGRAYSFKTWSNAGPPTQSVTVDSSAVDNGMRLTASFDILSRLTLQSTPPGMTVQVDGTSCTTPCNIDRPNGSQVHVTAKTSIPVDDNSRLDLVSWSDGGPSDHVYTMNADTQTLTVNYQTMYRLSASGNPANGASFNFTPFAGDSFYPANTNVTVAANANPGFKFHRWNGDASGTYPQTTVSMNTSMNVVALLDRVPYIAPAGVKNAAGDTPDGTVAPGSIIAIWGESMAPDTVTGPTNPLSQTLDGVIVTVGDQMLPLLMVSPEQITAQLPPDLPEGQYTLKVTSIGQPDVTGTFTVAINSPGVFSNTTVSQPVALAVHQDGTPVTSDNPAIQGETITVYGTGFGNLQQPMVYGFLTVNPQPDALLDPLEIHLGDSLPAPVWSGAATDYIGMMVTKFQITPDLPTGVTLPLKVRVNGRDSNTVMLPLQ